jgi:hypothetical protein
MTESKNNKEKEIEIKSPSISAKIKSEETDAQKQCISCFQKIHISATVCQHCGQRQNWWGRHFGDAAIIVSIVMMLISFTQLMIAFKQKRDASKALDIAKTAAKDANEARTQTVAYAAEVKQKLTETDSALRKAKENLSNLESYSQYYAVVIAAQGEDRIAYDQLGKLAADNSFPFRVHAYQTYQKIRDDHSQIIFDSKLPLIWKEGVDPNKLTFEQLKQQFSSANQDPYLRRAFLEYIWQRNDIPKILRLDFVVDVMRTDKHLMVCEYAGRYFTQGVELKIKPLALDYLIKWWADNRSKFEEKPDPNK